MSIRDVFPPSDPTERLGAVLGGKTDLDLRRPGARGALAGALPRTLLELIRRPGLDAPGGAHHAARGRRAAGAGALAADDRALARADPPSARRTSSASGSTTRPRQGKRAGARTRAQDSRASGLLHQNADDGERPVRSHPVGSARSPSRWTTKSSSASSSACGGRNIARGRGARSRLRLHDHQRRVGARPAEAAPAVVQGQEPRRLLPDGPGRRHRGRVRRSAEQADLAARQRRARSRTRRPRT